MGNANKEVHKLINKNKLLGKIKEKGHSQQSLAQTISAKGKVKFSLNTLNSKINGKGFFNTDEIQAICEELEITSPFEKADIFLNQNSQKWEI